ncbi:probable UDP-N-acetylglucosamine--peptide N-acetylglucosaminyltransferase SEC [Quercus suber]|uniref:probable UDP-N-acetylglucosamine--peptide N-acetylglucosaminyltransferase SEC n=1 Tax=Quercus suber TaxID=58331 RepID=UPI0032DEADF2
MLSLQGDPRLSHHHQHHHHHQQQLLQQQQLQLQKLQLAPYNDDSLAASSSSSSSLPNLKHSQALDSHEVDEGMLIAHAHQMYKAGNFKQALEHCNAVYERNPQRTDNLLLLGAIHYQLHDFDMCIAKNEEALQIDPRFAECYGNMANAWKEKGNIDFAIRYYLIAIEVCHS